MNESITVVTITKDRPQLLRRAIESVRSQRCSHPVYHHVVVEAGGESADELRSANNLPSELSLTFVDQSLRKDYFPARLAELRNIAIDKSESPWLAFLDDDNEFENNHLESLISLAKSTDTNVAHSARKLFHHDGTPYLNQEWPWGETAEDRRRIYNRYLERGVVSAGSNVTFDRCNLAGHPDPIRNVDTSEWLVHRDVMNGFSFPVDFSQDEMDAGLYEDEKLQQRFVRQGVEMKSTELPTLRYYLGGHSNIGSRK